jgi:hypothetical protein
VEAAWVEAVMQAPQAAVTTAMQAIQAMQVMSVTMAMQAIQAMQVIMATTVIMAMVSMPATAADATTTTTITTATTDAIEPKTPLFYFLGMPIQNECYYLKILSTLIVGAGTVPLKVVACITFPCGSVRSVSYATKEYLCMRSPFLAIFSAVCIHGKV